jgi:hypothetical protein
MKKDEILVDYGWCQVIKRGNKYLLNYDSGGIAIQMIEISISESEANISLQNQIEAEKVIRKYR